MPACPCWQQHFGLRRRRLSSAQWVGSVYILEWKLTKNYTHTHTHPFNGPLTWTTRVSRYQKSKTNLDLTEARDSEWQWHQLGHMQVCILLQTDNHTSTHPQFFPATQPTASKHWRPKQKINKRKRQLTLQFQASKVDAVRKCQDNERDTLWEHRRSLLGQRTVQMSSAAVGRAPVHQRWLATSVSSGLYKHNQSTDTALISIIQRRHLQLKTAHFPDKNS